MPLWCLCRVSVGVKARVVNRKRKQVDVAASSSEIIPAVLECTNCSLHATVGGALSETVATVSLRTVPRLSLLSRQCCRLRVGKRTCEGGLAVSLTQLTVRSRWIKCRCI